MINKVILIGNLGADPDVRTNQYGEMCTASLATTEWWKDKDSGEMKSKTEWHKIFTSGYSAKKLGNFRKGDQVYIEGKIETRKYSKDGQDRYITQVVARVINKLGKKDRDDGYSSGGYDNYEPPPGFMGDTGDDVPF